jgi:ABC-2 type transport system permease protein
VRAANVLQLGIKELRGLVRDPILLIMIAYAFTLSVYTAATAVPETLNKASIAIVDEDQSELSSRITTAFYPPYFEVPKLISQSEMDKRLDRGISTFALDIPPNFQRDVLAGRSPAIQLNVDATRVSQAYTGQAYVRQIVTSEVSEFLKRYRANANAPVDLVLRARFNPQLYRSWFGAVTNVMTQITTLAMVLTGAALIREREHGTIEHLLVMPVTAFEIMVSKIWSMTLVVLLASGLSLTLIVQGLLAIPIEGSLALFMAAAMLHVFATTSIGIALATVAGSMPQFGLLLMLVQLPTQALSGALTPRESMPQVIQDIMLAVPDTYFVMLAQSVLFRGAAFEAVWPQFAALLAIGVVFFTFSLRRFRQFLK